MTTPVSSILDYSEDRFISFETKYNIIPLETSKKISGNSPTMVYKLINKQMKPL